MAAAGSPQTAAVDQYRAAVEGYRSVIKWVLSSFAAVAAALIAGLQLSTLGQVEGEALFWSLLGITVAFVGILAIILFAVQVLVPIGATYRQFEHSKDFKPLLSYLERDNAPLRRKATSASGLADAYDAAIETEMTAEKFSKEKPADPERKQRLEDATAERKELFEIVAAVTRLGLTLRTEQLFKRAMWAVRVGVVAAAIGGVVFAYFANPPKAPAATEASSPGPAWHCGRCEQDHWQR
jgi:hypothetical protein